jgi:NodT family efflux transporter outer membrane factor (OMF) lipoprotein
MKIIIRISTLINIARRNLSGLRVILLGGLALLALGGCAVGPDYVEPEIQSPADWHADLQDGLTPEPVDPQTLAQWWKTLKDEILSSLMERAVLGNLDLKNAEARVREARALRGIRWSGFFPTVDLTGLANKSRSSDNSDTGRVRELYAVGFDAAWELDVFGGVRRSVEAADAVLSASRENLHDVLVSLLAEVALNYVETRTFQARLQVARDNITAQEETYELVRSRFEAGLSDELGVQQARYNLENTRSQIPTLRTGLAAAQNRLAVLLGEAPGAVHQELGGPRPIPVPPLTIAIGVPADTLRHRPDVRRFERLLAAQTARIGVATADLYPKFFLHGTIGLESTTAGNLLRSGSRTWGFGPGVSWNLFDAGAIRRNIEVQSALQEQALNQYESTILGALEEVENAVVAYAEEQFRRESLSSAAEAANRAVLLAQDQYKAGLVDFNNVLDAQRSLLSFQDALTLSEGTVTSNLVRLYKALGGGWEKQGGTI